MKKLASWKDLKKGRVYNRVYIGPNKAYAKINGKETFVVTQTTPELKVRELFCQFGDPNSKQIWSTSEITYGTPDIAFAEVELFRPRSSDEWFKKSIKFPSMRAAKEAGLITRSMMRQVANWHGHCPFVACMGGAPNYELRSVYCHFSVEGKTKHPMLQTVFVVWKNWGAMQADFKSFRIKPRT